MRYERKLVREGIAILVQTGKLKLFWAEETKNNSAQLYLCLRRSPNWTWPLGC